MYSKVLTLMSLITLCMSANNALDEALGCWVLPDCVSLETGTSTVWLANQTILVSKGGAFESLATNFETHYANLAHIEIYADPSCAIKLQSIDWFTPIIDQGESDNVTTPGLRMARKVAWDLIAPSAYNDRSLFLPQLVIQYNAAAENCSWDEPWRLGLPFSVKRKECSLLGQSCPLSDMLIIRKLGLFSPLQLTVSNRPPTCDPADRSESPADWWLTKTTDNTQCGYKPDQYPAF